MLDVCLLTVKDLRHVTLVNLAVDMKLIQWCSIPELYKLIVDFKNMLDSRGRTSWSTSPVIKICYIVSSVSLSTYGWPGCLWCVPNHILCIYCVLWRPVCAVLCLVCLVFVSVSLVSWLVCGARLSWCILSVCHGVFWWCVLSVVHPVSGMSCLSMVHLVSPVCLWCIL